MHMDEQYGLIIYVYLCCSVLFVVEPISHIVQLSNLNCQFVQLFSDWNQVNLLFLILDISSLRNIFFSSVWFNTAPLVELYTELPHLSVIILSHVNVLMSSDTVVSLRQMYWLYTRDWPSWGWLCRIHCQRSSCESPIHLLGVAVPNPFTRRASHHYSSQTDKHKSVSIWCNSKCTNFEFRYLYNV
jgi:hypothetical protein